jgi:D-3-phosphoglycerate dehydrogenase
MPLKILISDKIEPICPRLLREKGFQVDENHGLNSEALAEIIGQYHGLVVRGATKVTEPLLSKGRQGLLRVVARAGAGVDNIDVEAARKLGLKVFNTPGLNANAVAELAVGLMIILSRKLWPAMKTLRDGLWDKKNLSGFELRGKTLGLLGLGSVGRLMAAKGSGLGLNILAHDPLLSPGDIREFEAEPASFSELFSRSDYVSLHLPETADTSGIVGAEALNLMKSTSYLINCARGGLVDEEALYKALAGSRLAGAATDVFLREPPDPSPLFELPNFVAVPHLGASTEEAQLAVAEEAAKLVADYLSSQAGLEPA